MYLKIEGVIQNCWTEEWSESKSSLISDTSVWRYFHHWWFDVFIREQVISVENEDFGYPNLWIELIESLQMWVTWSTFARVLNKELFIMSFDVLSPEESHFSLQSDHSIVRTKIASMWPMFRLMSLIVIIWNVTSTSTGWKLSSSWSHWKTHLENRISSFSVRIFHFVKWSILVWSENLKTT